MATVPEMTEATTIGMDDETYGAIESLDRRIKFKNWIKSWFGIGSRHLGEFTSLANAVSTIGSAQAVLTIASDTTVSADLVIPSTLLLDPVGAAKITISSGVTLTINSGESGWPARQIFTGNGSVKTPNASVSDPRWYGYVGDGATDDTAAIQKAVDAYDVNIGGTVILTSAQAGIGASLNGTAKNIRLVGVAGKTRLKKLNSGGTSSILHYSYPYSGWTFENIEFDGNVDVVSALPDFTIYMLQSRDLTFRNCKFRGIKGSILGEGAERIKFIDCELYGTRPGVMAAATQDPAAVASAAYTLGVQFNQGCIDTIFERCTFHFLQSGIGANGTATTAMRGLHIRGSKFRGDWWNGPFTQAKVTGSAFSGGVLTISAGSFAGLFTGGNALQIITVPIQVTTGASFTSTANNNVTVSAAIATARRGDVFETADGKRGEILSVASTTSFIIAGWESIDTFEPTTAPAAATAWRLMRYYAAGGTRISDTQLDVYLDDFTNPFDGEKLVGDAGLSPIGKICKVGAVLGYSGVHLNGGVFDFSISGSRLRGIRSDQISIFDSEAPSIEKCLIELGFDEGLTLNGAHRASVIGNRFLDCGVSALFNSSRNITFTGNTVNNWGSVNGRGAIDGALPAAAVSANTFRSSGFFRPSYAVTLFADSTDADIFGNTDEGGRVATLEVTADAGSVKTRGVYSIDGAGRDKVIVGDAETWTLQTGLALYFPLSDEIDKRYGIIPFNGGATFEAGKVGNAARFNAAFERLDVADNPIVRMGDIDFSFCLWVKLNTLTSGFIFGKFSGGASTYEYALEYVAGSNRLQWNTSNGTSFGLVQASSFGALSAGTWFFVRVGYDKTNARSFIQVNGGAIDTVSLANGVNVSTNTLSIGAGTGGASSIDGWVDEFALWKYRRLNSDDTAKLYNGGTGITWPLF